MSVEEYYEVIEHTSDIISMHPGQHDEVGEEGERRGKGRRSGNVGVVTKNVLKQKKKLLNISKLSSQLI